MKNIIDAYMTHEKITIPATVLVAVLLVGGIVWGVYATTSAKDEPTLTTSKEVDTKADTTDAKKATEKKAENETSDKKTTSNEKDDTKSSAIGSVTDAKKDTSKKEHTSNKDEGLNNSSSTYTNNNQQTTAEPETPAETYDSYGRPMSCSSTFFTTYNGTPAWKQSTIPSDAFDVDRETGPYVIYKRNGKLIAHSERRYNILVPMYNDGIRDCPSCGSEFYNELTF